MNNKRNMKSKVSFILILLVSIFVVFQKIKITTSINQGNYGVIDWDNYGYYVYLPAIFIYNDLKLKDDSWVLETQKKYKLSSNFYQAHQLENGNRVIQYTSGMAFLYSPGFVVGHITALIYEKYEADGFSQPYQVAILIQSFLMVFLGLFFLRKLGLLYFSDLITTFSILCIVLGTNYFQLTPGNIASPHVYLFVAYSFLLFYIIKWHQSPTIKKALAIGIAAALMILSRPNELLFLIIPLFLIAGQFNTMKEKFIFLLNNKSQLLALVLPLIIFGVIQPIYWYMVTGEVFYDSYKNEDFKLLNPYLSEYLFSYKKGWLLYTPLMVFGLLGLYFVIKRNKSLGVLITVFMTLNVWVLSSWDCWWYADSFSQRSIVQSYPIFLFSFGYLFNEFQHNLKPVRIIIYGIMIFMVGLNIFQTFQFNQSIIHQSLMTKEYYWNVFGITNFNAANRLLLDADRNINYLPEKHISKQSLIYTEEFSNGEQTYFEENGKSYFNEGSLVLNTQNRTSKKVTFAYKDIADSSYCYLVARVRFKSDYSVKENPFGIEYRTIDSYNGKGYGYKYRGAENIDWFHIGDWISMDLVVIPPFLRYKEDSIQLNLVYFGNQSVEVDRLSIEVLDPSTKSDLEKMVFYQDYHTISGPEWSNPRKQIGDKKFELIDSLFEYSGTLQMPLKSLKGKTLLEVHAKVSLDQSNYTTSAVVSVSKGAESLYYKSFPILSERQGWEMLKFEYQLPKNLPEDAEIKVYLWNKSVQQTLIKSIKVIAK